MEIQEIKQRLTLATVLNYYSLKPDKNLRLCCPFHNDKTPSMQVYYKTHTAYCFSSNCKTHGKPIDVIDFILHKENCSKHEAIGIALQLIVNGELLIINEGKPNKMNAANEPLTIHNSSLTIKKPAFLGNMFQYFKNAVHNSRPAQEYIKSRGLDATKLEIGYNTAQFHHGARKEETLINNCVAVGLLSPWGTSKTGEQAYKAFAKFCICFALKDRDKQITGLYFRSTASTPSNSPKGGENEASTSSVTSSSNGTSTSSVTSSITSSVTSSVTSSATESRHFYLKESSGLYPGYPEAETKKLIVTESIIDCASMLQYQSEMAQHLHLSANQLQFLATYGTNRLNEEMRQAIAALQNLEEIVFAFDNDEAGNKAALKYAKELSIIHSQLSITKLELPCKDVNETLIAHNEDIFSHLLDHRQDFFLSPENLDQTTEKPAALETKTAEHPPKKETEKFNTQNPNKLIYTPASGTSYTVLGGLPKQLDMLKVMLQIENN